MNQYSPVHLITELFQNTYKIHILSCFLSGILATFSTQPHNFIPLLFFCVVPVYYFIIYTKPKHLFCIGFSFGFGWFLASLYWIISPLFILGPSYYWVSPFAFLGLPLLLSLFWGWAFSMPALIDLDKTGKIILLVIFWSLAEWLRGNILSGFPWSMIGSIMYFPLEVAYSASYVGAYGQNLIVILLIVSPILLIINNKKIALIFVMTACFIIFTGIYKFHSTKIIKSQNLVRIVQPAFTHKQKWDRKKFWLNMQNLAYLSKQEKSIPNLIIWPETAITTFPENLPQDFPSWLKEFFLSSKSYLITGMPTKKVENNSTKFFNSAVLFNEDGKLTDQYEKIKLVPFGEFIPFSNYFPFINILVGENEFNKGKDKNLFYIEGIGKIRLLICYEAIFPGFINSKTHPDLLVNITNDYWFGNTIGPEQHLILSRQRAIETGVPLIRVSNSGISSGFDPLGKELDRLKFGRTGFLDITLPKKIETTFFYKRGNTIFFIMVLLLIGCYFLIKIFKTKFDQ